MEQVNIKDDNRILQNALMQRSKHDILMIRNKVNTKKTSKRRIDFKERIDDEQFDKLLDRLDTDNISEEELESMNKSSSEQEFKEYHKKAKRFDDKFLPLEDSFPYPQIRNQQQYILDKLKLCDDKKYIVLEAMPGVGKSAIAKTVLSHFGNGYVITATKQLQDQYDKEFDDVKTIKGKINYLCAKSTGLSCKSADCERNKAMRKECMDICPYYRAVKEAARANITVTSYAYFFTWLQRKSVFKPRKILVLDECHLIDDQINSWSAIRLNPDKLNKKYHIYDNKLIDDNFNELLIISATEFEEGYTKNNELFFETLYEVLKKKLHEIEYSIDNISKKTDVTKLMSDRDSLTRLIGQMYKFRKAKNKNEWLIVPDVASDGSRELLIEPLYVGRIFKDYIDKFGVDHIIFMSATILNAKLFCEELGITKNEVGIIKVDSSFDPKKSPIYYKGVGRMNYVNLPNTIPKIIKAVKDIIDQHKNERGIIHTGNYKIAQAIVNGIRSDRLILKQTYESNEDILVRHNNSKNGILVSPSLNTGTDLKDDLSRFQIIVKMPFLSLADKRVKKKSEIDNNWYICDMLRTLIQASGRSTRSEEDYSVTYVLDSSFPYWINKYRSWLPKQFLERIIMN